MVNSLTRATQKMEPVTSTTTHEDVADLSKLSLFEEDEVATEASRVEEANYDVATSTSGDNPKKLLRRVSSGYIRAHDLSIPDEMKQGGAKVSSTTLHETVLANQGRQGPDLTATQGLFLVDNDLSLTLNKLVQLGFAVATDESNRFIPGRETANILRRRESQPSLKPTVEPEWPIQLWHAANPSALNEILIWNGTVNNHQGFGHDWPIIKARGIVPAPPRTVAEFLWNSANVHHYNSMSVGRHDGTVFQEDMDTLAEDSAYGFAGSAKIMKSHNKVKLVPRIIEIVSMLHARPLGPPLAAPGTYIIVNRSIWESDGEDTENHYTTTNVNGLDNSKLIRSEMLLGVQLLRPIDDGKACEMTTITHALVPGMNNKMLARAAASVSAAKILRDIQAFYSKK